MSISIPFNDSRQFKALTGTSPDEFNQLLPTFQDNYYKWQREEFEKNKATRKRKLGGGRKAVLSTVTSKLFFILYYFKVYPTFDVLGHTFGFNRSRACRHVHHLTPILQNTLSDLGVLPHREFTSVEEFNAAFSEIEDLFIDVTERPRFRPKDNQAQEKTYSGKKKDHTGKNTVISNSQRKILFLGYTVTGNIHDFKLLKQEFPAAQNWFEMFKLWVDLGYLGIKNTYKAVEIYIPHRKPRKSKKNPNPTLTPEQKEENRKMSKVRVIVENAIGGMKRFNIVMHTFRNKKDEFMDEVAWLSAGLWNWKLKCK